MFGWVRPLFKSKKDGYDEYVEHLERRVEALQKKLGVAPRRGPHTVGLDLGFAICEECDQQFLYDGCAWKYEWVQCNGCNHIQSRNANRQPIRLTGTS